MPAFGRFAQQYGREMERGQRLQESITRLFGAVQRKQEMEQRRARDAHDRTLGELADPRRWLRFTPEEQAGTLGRLNQHREGLEMEPLSELPDPRPGAYADLVLQASLNLQKGIGVDPERNISELVFEPFKRLLGEDWLHRNNVDTHNRAAITEPAPEEQVREGERPPGAPEGRAPRQPPEAAMPVPTAPTRFTPWRESLRQMLAPYVAKVPTREEQIDAFESNLGAWVLMSQNPDVTPEQIESEKQRLVGQASQLGLPYDEHTLEMHRYAALQEARPPEPPARTTAQLADDLRADIQQSIHYIGDRYERGATDEETRNDRQALWDKVAQLNELEGRAGIEVLGEEMTPGYARVGAMGVAEKRRIELAEREEKRRAAEAARGPAAPKAPEEKIGMGTITTYTSQRTALLREKQELLREVKAIDPDTEERIVKPGSQREKEIRDRLNQIAAEVIRLNRLIEPKLGRLPPVGKPALELSMKSKRDFQKLLLEAKAEAGDWPTEDQAWGFIRDVKKWKWNEGATRRAYAEIRDGKIKPETPPAKKGRKPSERIRRMIEELRK